MKKNVHGRGGSGRGQGRKRLKNKREKISTNIPPSMLRKIRSLQTETGDSLSSTIVWILDHGLKAINENKIL